MTSPARDTLKRLRDMAEWLSDGSHVIAETPAKEHANDLRTLLDAYEAVSVNASQPSDLAAKPTDLGEASSNGFSPTRDDAQVGTKAVVLQDGHIDHITGPRCIVRMSEGPRTGLYVIVHTDAVLGEGTPVLVDDRLRARTAVKADAVGTDERSEGVNT